MRLKRSRIQTFYHRKRTVEKDEEGSTRESYGAAVPFSGEFWPASGKVQAEQYGQRLSGIRNLKIQNPYSVHADEAGRPHYILDNGADIQESDGICIYAYGEQKPDYKVLSVKPYRFLTMEVERIDGK